MRQRISVPAETFSCRSRSSSFCVEFPCLFRYHIPYTWDPLIFPFYFYNIYETGPTCSEYPHGCCRHALCGYDFFSVKITSHSIVARHTVCTNKTDVFCMSRLLYVKSSIYPHLIHCTYMYMCNGLI